MSRGSRYDQSIQHPADRAVVHPGSPYPPPCHGVWGVEAAFRPLSQRVAPVAVMFPAASSQEERHRLRCLLSPLGGGPLHITAGRHGMLTVVLAPVDRSRSAGSEEMSNPLRIASSKWAEGSAPMASSCSLSPSWSEGGRDTQWGGSSFGPGMSPGSPLWNVGAQG